MPATLNKLTAKTVKLAIAVDDDPEAITVWYRPHNMTAKVEERVQEEAGKNLELAALVEMTQSVLADWDLAMNEGEPTIPITKEGLSEVPASILMLIMEAISKDRKPDPKGTD